MIRREPVDARRENRLHGRRYPQLAKRLGEFYGSVAHQRALIKQHLHSLFHEKRVALGLFNNQPLQRLQVLAVTKQR